MANGNDLGVAPIKIPGIAVGGGLVLSNTTVFIGAMAALGVGYLLMQNAQQTTIQKVAKMEAKELSLPVVEKKIYDDVVAYATYPDSVHANRDRILAVIKAFRMRIKEWMRKFREGQITREQYTTEIRNIWRQVRDELELPVNSELVPPHLPAPAHVPGWFAGAVTTAHPRPMFDNNGRHLGWTKGKHHGWLHAMARTKFNNHPPF